MGNYELMDDDHGSDEDLMSAVRNGRFDEMEHLFERHHPALVAYCAKITGDRDLARDLAQETFFRIFRSRESFEEGSRFTPWVYSVARNACLDHLRRRRPVAVDLSILDLKDEAVLASEHLEHRENLDRLENALLRLEPAKRELILLARDETKGYREIARSLGISLSSLKVRVHRAMKELKSIYREMEHELV